MSSAHIIPVRNVNQALVDGLQWLCVAGHTAPSRNGPVLVAPGPVITAYRNPTERVLFSPVRDANPFFHLYECVWMLAGRNDAASVAHYAKNMLNYADEDVLHGAYGYRWREWWGFDQIAEIIKELKRDPTSRRCVLAMWSPSGDLVASEGAGGLSMRDLPCNTHVYFDAHTGRLDMTVCNRSNDAVWGAYGANAVHMSFLQEVVAGCIGIPVGTYYQMSNNLHVYTENEVAQRLLVPRPIGGGYSMRSFASEDLYDTGRMETCEIEAQDYEFFAELCEHAAEHPQGPSNGYSNPWLEDTFTPMLCAHAAYKAGELEAALGLCSECASEDWRTAGLAWLQRRIDKKQESSV